MFKLMLERSTAILSSIYLHPFNQQLQQGTLPKPVFQHYLQQDALYLHDFAKVLGIIAERLEDPNHSQQFRQLADDTLQAELDLNTRYFPKAQANTFFSPAFASGTEKIPVIDSYTQHLLQAANNASIEEAVASCLPCFWTYKELGIQMNEKGNTPGNPYQDWIDTYSGAEFVESTKTLMEAASLICNNITCPTRQEMVIMAFQRSAEFELCFFESALSLSERQQTISPAYFD